MKKLAHLLFAISFLFTLSSFADTKSIKDKITLFAVVKLNNSSVNNYQGIVGKGNGSPNYSFLWALLPNETRFGVYLGSVHTFWSDLSLTPINPNTWTMVAATWDSASHTLTYYTNGHVDGSYTTASGQLETNSNPIEIGNMINGSYPLDGRVKELQIYNRVLTARQIHNKCLLLKFRFAGLKCK